MAVGAPRAAVLADHRQRACPPGAPSLLGRDFHAAAPDRVWLADLTYIWTAEGWLYLAVVLDLFSRRVVGWAMAEHLGHELALAALDMAIARRGARHRASSTIWTAACAAQAQLVVATPA